MNSVWKNLSFTQKLRYLWDYYRYPVLACLILLALGIYALITMATPKKTVVLNLTFTGTSRQITETPELFTAFEEQFLDTQTERVALESVTDPLTVSGQVFSSIYQLLSAKFLSGEIDLFFAPRETLSFLGESGVFLSPESFLTPEERTVLADSYICYENEAGEAVPVGISLRQSDLFARSGLMPEDAGVAVSAVSADPELAHLLIEYLFKLPYTGREEE